MLRSLFYTMHFLKSFFTKISVIQILSLTFIVFRISFAQDTDFFPPNQWIAAPNLFFPRTAHTATLLEDGRVLILGYNNDQAEIYDPVSNTISLAGNTIYSHQQGFTATLLNDRKVLIVGGIFAQQQAELFNPQTNTFEATGNLNHVHSFHTATLLPDGRVLIAGGQDQQIIQTHSVCEIYDPSTGTFTLTDTLKDHRSSHESILLPNGKILISGGIQTTSPGFGITLNSCELYNPINGTFSYTQNLLQPREGHEITLLKNEKVLVTGGAYYESAGEIFDPQTETWTLTGQMTVQRRSYHTATRIYNGKVLLAGGNISYITAKAELYDPSTNSFSEIDSMITARQQHTATLLHDGSVFVTGGYTTSSVTNHTERYIIDTSVVSVREINDVNSNLINDFVLFQNYPNPFNSSTKISWQSSVGSLQVLKVFDVLGNEVATLVNKELEAGYHSIDFDTNKLLSGVSAKSGYTSGVYFYQLLVSALQSKDVRAGSFIVTKKMVLMR